MTYRVGDDVSEVYPVIDDAQPPGQLDFTVVVKAWKADGTTVEISGADWSGAQVDDQRDLAVPLATLGAGIWGIGLVVDDGEDLFLGNVVIQ